MMLGQLNEKLNNNDKATQIYKEGVKQASNSINLWICASKCEEKQSSSKARSLLERARLKNPKSPKLWIEAINVEQRVLNNVMAESLIAKALQDCPHSGLIWAKAISMEQRKKKIGKVLQALKECDSDPYVMMSAATVFWEDRKIDKARSWFNRAVTLNPDIGDIWAIYYKFELQHGTTEQQQNIINKCIEAEPHHGDKWCSISKLVENTHKSIEELLKLVARNIE